MNLSTWYSSGLVSVGAGSTTVTGTGSLWGTGGTDDNIMVGDLFCVPSQPMVPAVPIAAVTANGELELLWPWPGTGVAAEPYIIRYVGIIERSTRANRMALERMGEVSAWYDVIVVDNASRLALETASNPLRADYRVLVKDDGAIWAKQTSAFGDWIGPVEFKGDTGQKGWSSVHGIVTDGARRVWRLVEWVGGQGAPPPDAGKYVGPSGLVDDIAAATDVRGPAGQDGTGTGDMVGPEGADDGAFVGFDGPTGKKTKQLSAAVATSMLNVVAQDLKGLAPAPSAADILAKRLLAASGAWVDPDPWADQPVGVPIPLMSDLTGTAAPPTDRMYRYIKLTASDAYNVGVLSGESVSGSAPLVQATATITLPGSPLNGQTVRLINTERRSLRAGSAGTVEADSLQGHLHLRNPSGVSEYWLTAGATERSFTATGDVKLNSGTSTGIPISDGTNGAPRTASETRAKNIGVDYYMRIK